MNVILPFLIVGVILSIISLLFLRSGFKELVRAGRDLKTGLTGASIYLVAFVLLMIGVAVLFTSLVQVLPSISSNAPPPSPYLAPLVGGVLIVIIGAIAALVGVIMVIIGLYKVGSIYQDGLIKVGAILIIIPYLNIVAPFLLFFGLGNAIRKAETGFSPQMQNYSTTSPFSVPASTTSTRSCSVPGRSGDFGRQWSGEADPVLSFSLDLIFCSFADAHGT